jgi:hypothetical protein
MMVSAMNVPKLQAASFGPPGLNAFDDRASPLCRRSFRKMAKLGQTPIRRQKRLDFTVWAWAQRAILALDSMRFEACLLQSHEGRGLLEKRISAAVPWR